MRVARTGSNRQECRFVVVQDGLSTYKDIIWNGVAAAKGFPIALMNHYSKGTLYLWTILGI